MTTVAHTSADSRRAVATRVAAALRTEVGLARLALAVVSLHVVDDNFLQPNPGTSAGDHLVSGLVPLGLLVLAGVVYPRLRAGARATIALLAGFFGVLAGTEAVHYTRAVGASGDDYTGLLSIPAGLLLIGLGASRCGGRAEPTTDFGGATCAGSCSSPRRSSSQCAVLLPFAIAYVVTHAARATVPTADLGAPYENVEFRTADGLRLKGWYIRSRNRAAVISFPGRASSQKRAKLLARHGYGVLLFDRRGEGESEGDPNTFGWHGERDIHAAVAYLQRQPDVDPGRIGGIGLSVGGEMMIEAAAESSDAEGDRLRGRERPLRPGRDRERKRLAGADRQRRRDRRDRGLHEQPAAPHPEEPRAEDLRRRRSSSTGNTASRPSGPRTEAFYAAARGQKAIWEVPGLRAHRRHGGTAAEYERRVTEFFDRWLQPRR